MTTHAKPHPAAPAVYRCRLCADTGVVQTYEPKLIGHASDGSPVYNPRTLVLVQRFCDCRKEGAA